MATATLPRLNIYGVADSWQTLAQHLEDCDGVLDETTSNILDALEAQTPDVIDNSAGIVRYFEAQADEIGAEIERLRAKRIASESAAARVREAICRAMGAADLKTHRGRFTVTRQPGRKRVSIVDPESIPAVYLTPQPPKVDAKAVAEHLKEGVDVPGAELVAGDAFVVIR